MLLGLGCGASEKAPQEPVRHVEVREEVDASIALPEDAGTIPDASTPTVAREEALPPPKPTTLSLATTRDAKLDALLSAGDRSFEAGEWKAARASYEEARKQAPKRAAPKVGVARVQVQEASRGNFGFASAQANPKILAAAKELRMAAATEPSFGPAEIELGRALLLLGDGVQAETALRHGVELLPNEPEAHSALGIALLATGKRQEALSELTRARDLDPGSAERRGNLGTVLFMNGRVAEAIDEYRVFVRLVPDEPRGHSDLGTALLAQNDVTAAIPELRRAIELDDKRATFHSNYGYALQRSGRVDEAIVEYKKATALDPKLASAWINLATALAQNPATRDEARKALKTAEKIDASDPRVKANLEELDALERGHRR